MLYRFDNVEKSYGPHDILRGVTWQHNPGEHVGLVGRNGAGKTTLFRLLLKQEEPDHGQIIDPRDLAKGIRGAGQRGRNHARVMLDVFRRSLELRDCGFRRLFVFVALSRSAD